MKAILLNPFFKFQEKTLLIIGITATIVGSIIGFVQESRYDGIFDIHFSSEKVQWFHPFLDNIVNIVVLSILLFVFGKKINSKTRFIDLLNTVLIARIPIYLNAIIIMNEYMNRISQNILENISENPVNPMANTSFTDLILLLVSSVFAIITLIWSIALTYNGFKTASNSKGAKNILWFILMLIIAEILSKIIINLF